MAGITRTAVVLLLIMPMAHSSAMIPQMASTLVSPGMAIISRPTEHTQVMASSFSSESAPVSAARIMPASSDTGMNAPDRPPTDDDAMTPPFFTASLSRASAAVVPGPPHVPTPMASRISATESPSAGVGASDRSRMPCCAPRRCDASRAMSSPARVILNAVALMASATVVRSASLGRSASTARTTPGPETPTLMTASASPDPWNAPAMKGLSSTALQNTTSLPAPMHWRSAVASAAAFTTPAIFSTASMLMPARVEPTFTDEHTLSVTDSAWGMESMSLTSAAEAPLCTSALKPPTKSTPTSLPARSMATATGVRSCASVAAHSSATGVMEMRLFTMGMPNSRSSCSAVGTRRSAALVMRSYTLRAMASMSASVQPRRLSPSVMVRMSRCCLLTIASVSAISAGVICMMPVFLSDGFGMRAASLANGACAGGSIRLFPAFLPTSDQEGRGCSEGRKAARNVFMVLSSPEMSPSVAFWHDRSALGPSRLASAEHRAYAAR